MSSSPSGATTIPSVSSDLLRNQAQNNPVLTENDNGNVMPLSPAAPHFEASESQPVPPLTHTQATFNLTGNGKAHTPSFANNSSSSSFNDGFSNIQEKVSSGLTAAGQTASTYMNQAVVAGKNVAEKIKKATASKPNNNANSIPSDTTSASTDTSSSSSSSSSSASSSSSGSISSSISSGLNAAGHTASVLMNEALEASRGVAGRITGTASKPSDTEQDEAASNGNPSFQSKIVTGIENFSNSASVTWNDAMATTKSYAAKVDESLGVSSKIHYVDEKLGVSAAVTGMDKKAADTANHLYTSIKKGQPSHAFNHATSVGAIGQAELKKHQKGPLPTTTEQSEEKHEIDMKEKENTNEEEEPAESVATTMEEEKVESASTKNEKLHELEVEDKPNGTRKGQDRKAKKQKRSAAA